MISDDRDHWAPAWWAFVLIVIALIFAAVFALAVALGWLVHKARAHGDYVWIAKEYSSCCGEKDCLRVYVSESEHGYTVIPDGDFVPRARTKPSRDGAHWRCYNLIWQGPMRGQPDRKSPRDGCLFISPGGS